MRKGRWEMCIGWGCMMLTGSISVGSTWTVTSANDSGTGSLREAMQKAQAGETVNFDPAVFLPNGPAPILLTNGLAAPSLDGLKIETSNVGIPASYFGLL